MSSATVHVLDRNDYSKHYIVSLPAQNDTSPLPPSSISIRPFILGQTTNNLTYARFGAFMGWYDIYPLPSSIPAPFNDTATYGRVPAWGYAEIVASNVPGIDVGQTVYGYLPIGTATETFSVDFAEHQGKKMSTQLLVTSEHRQHVWKVYNRYHLCPPLDQLIDERGGGIDNLGWDALMSGLFATGYNMNRHAFAWEEELRIHPSGEGEWTGQDADLEGSVVVVLNASGKTGRGFSYCLRQDRPKEYQPKAIVGVGSEASVGVLNESGLYDKVVRNDEAEETKKWIEEQGAKRVVLFEFGSRPGAADAWTAALTASKVPFKFIVIGGEVKVQDPESMKKRMADRGRLTAVNANVLREKGIDVYGEKYFDDFYAAWEEFKRTSRAMKIEWAEGMEAWRAGWEAFCKDEVRADRGLVYRV
ncbi:hypothetical protein IQ06DRAFT_297945 [Phaeosphaeriaceae sp. SRC1lsM3a]|nr:hypothetical protein IQ06DRAFT_297945 [Stagonospora sp. SRC1lsM3a]